MITTFARVRDRWGQLSKWRRFLALVTLAAAIAALVSNILFLTVLDRSTAPHLKIAVIAPLSGPEARIGQAMRDGVAQWVAGANRRIGKSDRQVSLVLFDETTDCDAVAHAAARPDVIGVVGPYGTESAANAEATLRAHGLPAVTLADVAPLQDDAGKRWLLPLAAGSTFEVRFLANYVRNVVGERLVSIIYPDTPRDAALADAFDQVMQRFGTRVVYKWPADATGAQRTAALKAVAQSIVQQKIAGTLLLLGEPDFAAEAFATLREANVPNRIAGPRSLATNAFRDALSRFWQAPGSIGGGLNGALVATPMLFDTAGTAAQLFKTNFTAAVGEPPDWVAALSYDAARLIGSLAEQPLTGSVEDMRAALRDALAARRAPDQAIAGLAGPIFFNARAGSSLATLIGAYDGLQLIAAPTQLSPIRDEGVSNYLDELTSGRALYVNDRFMYKTNVIYSGIRLEKVSDLNQDANTVGLGFVVWFRWTGAFDPQDIIFPNAVEPVRLVSPEREGKVGSLNYRAYRVDAKFFMNFSPDPRAYGTELLGASFRHRTLGRNNVMYVADIVGMGLGDERKAATATATGWLGRLFRSSNADTGELARQLTKTRVLAGAGGWVIDHAWLSQEIGTSGTDGDPVYVGFGRPEPLFSYLGLGVTVKPDAIDFRDVIPSNLMIYIAIFAFCGTALAYMLDRRDRGRFWRVQTVLLRLVAWPVLLMSGGALALDYALAHASLPIVNLVSMTTSLLWWLVPAQLLVICVERFVWQPLEVRTGRKVPTVFRIIGALLIYVGAGFGVVSYVIGKSITSLLATSGLMAMIIGLAVQSNLRDIFCGIMLNLEHPFAIGDYIRTNGMIGEVLDVTWRTTRVKTRDGTIVAIPNGRLADSAIENLSRANKFDVELTLLVDPGHPPEQILALIDHALEEVHDIDFRKKDVQFKGVQNIESNWTATYLIRLRVRDYMLRKPLAHVVWTKLWATMEAANIQWTHGASNGAPGSDVARPLVNESGRLADRTPAVSAAIPA